MFRLISRFFRQVYSEEEKSYREYMWKTIDELVPDSSKMDVEQWKRFKVQALKEIDQKILHARSVDKSPYQLDKERVNTINKKLEKEHELLTKGYTLTEEDYKTDIYPNLCRFSYFPGPGTAAWRGETVERQTYYLSSPDYRTSSEARDNLIGKCDVDAISNISKILRKNYEKLRCAELAGHESILLSQNRKACSLCNELEDEQPIRNLLAAYRNGSICFPHEIPWEDEVRYCEGPHLISVQKVGLTHN